MKKIVTIAILILVLTFAFAMNSMAESAVSLDTAVRYAFGGYEARVHVTDSTGEAVSYVYTVNGVDSEMTESAEYNAPIDFGVNELYVTAYDFSGNIIAVSDTIEITGNDYEKFSTLVNYDFDTVSATQTIYSYTPTAADKATITNEKLDIGGTHGKVAWMKSENWLNHEWSASRPELHTPDTNWFNKAAGKTAFIYELDVMPKQVGKEQGFGTFYYRNSASENKTFVPLTFTTDGKVRVVTSIGTSYSGAPEKPEFDAPADEWINFKFVMDSVNEEFIIMANGVVYSSFGFDSTENDANAFDFEKTAAYCRFPIVLGSSGVPEDKPLEFYIDNIKYEATNYVNRYAVSASTVTADGESEGLGGFPLSGASVKLEFSEVMEEITKEDITFEVNGDAIGFDFSFDSDTNTVIITPSYIFIGRENCKISYANVRTEDGAPSQKEPFIEFCSALPPCAVSECVTESIVPGEFSDFTVTVKNSTTDDKDAMILLGLYRDGGLESVIAGELYCTAGVDSSADVKLYIPEDYADSEYKTVAYLMYKNSFFIIDSLEYTE